MEINWDSLFDRLREQPLEHLGGYSPKLFSEYFFGYSQALDVHHKPPIEGEYGLPEFNRWFISNAYPGPQGFGSYCELLTETDHQALDLFFEFRRIAKASGWKEDDPLQPAASGESLTFLDLIRSESVTRRPAMYFGNGNWLPGLWAMWSGYVWAEKDLGVTGSRDAEVFHDFQEWLNKRFPFAQGANFGKIFQFLALDVQEKAFENFFDHLNLFLGGGAPDAHTERFQSFLDDAVAAALKEQARNKNPE